VPSLSANKRPEVSVSSVRVSDTVSIEIFTGMNATGSPERLIHIPHDRNFLATPSSLTPQPTNLIIVEIRSWRRQRIDVNFMILEDLYMGMASGLLCATYY
jgi:hypothetical protein